MLSAMLPSPQKVGETHEVEEEEEKERILLHGPSWSEMFVSRPVSFCFFSELFFFFLSGGIDELFGQKNPVT